LANWPLHLSIVSLAFGRDLGPRGLYVMLGILFANLLFITLFYKELKLTTFDAGLAASLGFAPVLLHYILMSLVSLTVVGAFDIVGSILVVALIVTPPAAAYLLTDHLERMIGLSVLIGALSAVSGYWLANLLDASIAGSMATMAGVIFFLVFLSAPERGLISAARRRVRQKWEFAQTMLAIHLFQPRKHPRISPGKPLRAFAANTCVGMRPFLPRWSNAPSTPA
jgi:manganese/zinc/iron transport system permease protein